MINTRENYLETMPIEKLLIRTSLPMILSMMVGALYNIVDSIFIAHVAHIGEEALTAISLVFPLQKTMIAIGAGLGIGVSTLLSRTPKERHYIEYKKVAANGIILGLFTYFLFLVFGVFAAESYFTIQTDNPMVIKYGTTYLSIISLGSIAMFNQFILERFLQSSGKKILTIIIQISSGIINIILDAVLIFGYFGFPAMGVAGAALATVIAQSIGAILLIIINFKTDTGFNIGIKNLRPDRYTIKAIYKIGLPSIFLVTITSITTYGINQILLAISNAATVVLGIYHKLQCFAFMPVFGLSNGMATIISYNYISNNKRRVKKAIKYTILYGTLFMMVNLIIIQNFSYEILSLYNGSKNMLNIGVPALKVISLSYILAGFGIVSDSIYQAFGNIKLSFIVSIVRQLIILLPSIYFLSLFNRQGLIWGAYPIAEVVSAILTAFFLKNIYRHKILPMKEKQKLLATIP